MPQLYWFGFFYARMIFEVMGNYSVSIKFIIQCSTTQRGWYCKVLEYAEEEFNKLANSLEAVTYQIDMWNLTLIYEVLYLLLSTYIKFNYEATRSFDDYFRYVKWIRHKQHQESHIELYQDVLRWLSILESLANVNCHIEFGIKIMF